MVSLVSFRIFSLRFPRQNWENTGKITCLTFNYDTIWHIWSSLENYCELDGMSLVPLHSSVLSPPFMGPFRQGFLSSDTIQVFLGMQKTTTVVPRTIYTKGNLVPSRHDTWHGCTNMKKKLVLNTHNIGRECKTNPIVQERGNIRIRPIGKCG